MVVLLFICAAALTFPTYRKLPYYLSSHKAYLVGFLLFYIGSYYREVVMVNPLLQKEAVQDNTLFIVGLGLFFYLFSNTLFYIVYYELSERSSIKYKTATAMTLEPGKSYGLIFLCFIGLCFLAVIKQTTLQNPNLWKNVGTLVLVLATLMYAQYSILNKLNTFNKIIILLSLLVCLLIMSRFVVLYLFLPFVLLPLAIYKKKIPILYSLLFFLIVLVLGSITKTIAVIDQYNLKQFFLTSDLFWIQVFIRIVTIDFLDTYANLILIVEEYPRTYHYLFGETLLNPWVNFIPRSIWPEKPEAFGVIIGRQFYPEANGTSIAPSFLGELWANFGYFGVVTGSLISGIITNHIDCNLSHGRLRKLAPGVYLPFLFFILHRGDLLLLSVLIYSFIPFIVFRLTIK